MRVSTEDRPVAVAPGATATITVDVVNTGSIIDGVTARLIGLDAAAVRVEPLLLPLFPDATGQLVLTVDVPDTHPAGTHPLVVEVLSHTTSNVAYADVDLEVAPRPMVVLRSTPRLVRARRSGRFVLEVDNPGNIPLEVTLSPAPTEPGIVLRLTPDTLRVEPGTSAPVMAVFKGPRMITGGEIDRTADVVLVGRRIEARPDEAEPPAELEASTAIALRQRPILSRGLITAMILLAIIGVWAGVFVFGLYSAFSNDPVPKAAAPSYYQGLNGTDAQAAAASSKDALFLDKDGPVGPDVGGSISGEVQAVTDQRPVGRVLVRAFRDCKQQPMATAATQSDGTYLLTGLFPTGYRLEFRADGYQTTWFPSEPVPCATTTKSTGQGKTGGAGTPAAKATSDAPVTDGPVTPPSTEPLLVDVSPGTAVVASDQPVLMTGLPGTLSGHVTTPDGTAGASTEVSISLLTNGAISTTGTAPVTTDAKGDYRFTGLASPGTYQIVFVTDGYANTSVVEELDGGEDLRRPDVLLGADNGAVRGVVSDGDGTALGGATVSTTVAGVPRTVVTPTQGAVGSYSLQDLPTPGTYVVSISAPDHGTRTVTVTLAAGTSKTKDVTLTSGTSSITGQVMADGAPLGGVEVTLGGVLGADGFAPTTITLTEGDLATQGTFSLNDVPAGTYTLTFVHPDYATQTQPVTVDGDGALDQPITLTQRLGSITGQILAFGTTDLVPGATVTVTNGSAVATAVNSDASVGDPVLPDGGFLLVGLEPGWYSVTANADGYQQRTVLVQVQARARPTPADLALRTGN